MRHLELISRFIEEKRDQLISISDQIWEYAETRFEEYRSAELLIHTLTEEGFEIERGLADMPTAFVATYGHGHPVVAILGEYDALSSLSQENGVAQHTPVTPGGNGHGCGHNLLGTGALAAALALKAMIDHEGLQGTVKYYGCPAEEGGSGKTYMAREGCFDGVDFALCWHPDTTNGIMPAASLANYQIYYRFKGKSSHAAASPELGRSALDAVELMNVGVNYLREHIISEARIHYAILNTGGFSPNVVQAEAEVLYLIRAPKASQLHSIYERVCDIARGAALMTGTGVEIVFDKACSNLVQNTTLETQMYEVFQAIGAPSFTDDEISFAERISETLTDEEKAAQFRIFSKDTARKLAGKVLSDIIHPYDPANVRTSGMGSTDVGDVSWLVPTAQCNTACWTLGSVPHTWQIVAHGCTSIGQQGMLLAGKVMAGTAYQMMTKPELLDQAKKELLERLDGETYQSPIPKEVKPARHRA